ncbi:hypothetical protein COLSTE_01152 [Collinsella stercoris DSM 13279]|uniref:Uncharacterized protein n=1 Tax=Collinsella stercoris DSM 13279 TaxID=445975 RepID=B6GAQ2_9ACTN|nr:hypothetical protein COLSTE_01152 [Collinsella stercoris DSM 13279]
MLAFVLSFVPGHQRFVLASNYTARVPTAIPALSQANDRQRIFGASPSRRACDKIAPASNTKGIRTYQRSGGVGDLHKKRSIRMPQIHCGSCPRLAY